MKIQGLEPYYFDIETTGLSGIQDDFVLAVVQNGNNVNVFLDLIEFFDYIKYNVQGILVGYNTENYRGGFDLPFLRSLTLRKGLIWPFAGLKHLDILPLVQSSLQTRIYEVKIPSQSSLRKADLTELAFINEISYTNTKETYAKLLELHKEGLCNWNGLEQVVTTESNTLDDVYAYFFDPGREEEYIDVEKLINQFKAREISYEEFVALNTIHCKDDVRRLKAVTEALLPLLPQNYVDRNLVTL